MRETNRHSLRPQAWRTAHLQEQNISKPDSKQPRNEAREHISDWTQLSPGDDVFLVMDGAELSSGVVDAVTEDGEILWLHLGGGAGRRLYIRSEGEDVWRVDAPGSV